jgi:uncharacterized membrane protein
MPQYSGVYVREKGSQKMTAFFSALWLCGLCVVAIYYTIPPSGMNPDIYGISLWILSSVVLVASVVILMVILISPVGIHPQCKFALWYCSPP